MRTPPIAVGCTPFAWLAFLIWGCLPPAAAQEPAPPPPAAPAEVQGAAPEQVPFLYELRGHGATAYLFGTVHLPDPRVLALPEVVERAFEASDAVYTEIETNFAAELKVAAASAMPKGETLGDLVGADLLARVHARVEAASLPPKLLDGFRPWAVASNLPLLEILTQMRDHEPLDKHLYERAQRAEKTVGGLETIPEQLSVFEGLTADEQTTMLRETLDQLDRYEAAGRDALEEMVQAWLSGQPARLLDLLEEGFGDDKALSQKLEQRLVWERNARFAVRIHAEITAAPTKVGFFAIGALHLPDGRLPEGASDAERERVRGVVTLLRAAGYEVVQRKAVEPVAVGAGR